MKNKIFITAILAGLMSLSSCSDDYLQENYADAGYIVLDGAIKTQSDLKISINGLYSTMSIFGGDYITYQELTGDIGFVSAKNSGYYVSTNAENHLAVDGGASTGIWASLYKSIANTNIVLAYEGKVPEAADESAVRTKTLFAHAKVIRAFDYLALLGLFSPNYGEGDQSLGVPYPVTYDIEAKLPRQSVSTVINNVISDLTSALAAFEADGNSAIYSNNNSFNTNAVKLILARAYMFKKDYTNAEKYAQEVIDLGGQLDSGSRFTSYFLSTAAAESDAETLFQLEYNSLSTNSLQPYWGMAGAYKQNFMAAPFYNSFSATDIRKKNTAWYANNATTYPDLPAPINVKKYISGIRDVVLLRKTEAYFIKAEAQYHTNPTTAFTTLKSWVIANRDPNYTATYTGTAVLDEILRQKGFEFFLEGMRFTDLKRNNKAVVKYQTNGVNGSSIGTIPVGDRRFIWPIPLGEIQTNPNITQAPNWDK